jgi:hypothetical protein
MKPQREKVLASIRMIGDDPDLREHFVTREPFNADLTWTADGKRILFCMPSQEHQRSLLYELDPESDDPPRRIEGTDPAINYMGGVTVTPDGTGIIVVTRE